MACYSLAFAIEGEATYREPVRHGPGPVMTRPAFTSHENARLGLLAKSFYKVECRVFLNRPRIDNRPKATAGKLDPARDKARKRAKKGT